MSLSYRFLQKTYDTIRRTEEEFENGDKFKDSNFFFFFKKKLTNIVLLTFLLRSADLVFFSRSPLSPFLYSKSPVFLEAMVDVNKVSKEPLQNNSSIYLLILLH